MKKIWIPLLLIVLLAFGFFVFNAFGEEKEAKTESLNVITETSRIDADTAIETHIPVDKIFEFSFSEELDKTTMTNETIKVLDKEQKETAIGIELSDDGKTMKIQAPKEGYKKGSVYQLKILEGIKYKNGNSVRNTYNMEFITERDEVEEVALNENLIFIKPEQVEVFKEKEVLVERSVKPDMAVGDIVIIPSEEHPEGQALKVTGLQKKKGMFQLTVEKPDFAELFNTLDIYKTYEIKKEHIEIEEGIEGLAVTDFAGTNLNTMLASSEGKSSSFEFKKPVSTKGIEPVKGIEFVFKNMPLGNDENSPVLNGSLSYHNAVAASDMRVGSEIRYQLSSINSSVNKFVLSSAPTKEKGGKVSKKKEFKKTNEKIKLAKLKVPTATPGLFVTGAFYLKVDYAFSYQPEVTVVFETEEERGVIYDEKTVKQINKFVPKLDASLEGTGTVETDAGAVINVNITAFGVTGVGVEAFGGVKGSGEFKTGTDRENGNYSCYEAAFNPVLQGNIFVDVFGQEIYKGHLANLNLNPKIIKGNCDVFLNLELKEKQVDLFAGETMEMSIQGLYKTLGSNKLQTLNLKNTKNLNVVSADETVVKVSVKNDLLVLTAADDPSKENTVVIIEYEEKGEAFNKATVSKIEIPIIIRGFQKYKKESLSEDEYLTLAKNTMRKILDILNETGKNHGLYDQVPGMYVLMETELSSFITDSFVERKMRNYVETDYYCQCDSTMKPRIDDAMIRVKIIAIDHETFRMEAIFLGDIHNPTRKQTLEFKKEGPEWKLNDWFDDLLNDADLNLLKEEVEAALSSPQSNRIARVTGEYISSDSGGPAYIVEVDGYTIGVDKRNGNELIDVPYEEENEVQNEQDHIREITSEEAVKLVEDYLNLEENSEVKFYYARENDIGHHVIHAYQFILDNPETGAGRDATYGWYGVNPKTGEIYDEILRIP